jgi:hypothetical protein
MVTVTNFFERQRKDGSSFIALELTGGVELIQSSTTNRWYATVRKCSITSTLTKQMAESIIGSKLEGNVVKVICEPYEYVNQRTGEIMSLQHSYAYQAEGEQEAIGHTRVSDLQMA